MKGEKEERYLLRLLISEFVKKRLPFGEQMSACLSDFEVVCKVSYRNMEFRRFIKKIIKEGYIEIFENKEIKGNLIPFYIVNPKLEDKFRETDLYKEIKKKVAVYY